MKHRASNPSTSSAITGFLRCLPVALIVVVPWTTARARGKSEWGLAPQTCVDAYTDGRERAGAGAVVAARALFQTCSNPQCGKRLRRECLSRQSQLEPEEAAAPVPAAAEKGAPQASQAPVEVKLDGRPFTSGVPGTVLPLEPGAHEFSFHARGQVLGKQEVLIGPNRCDSPISLSLRPDARSTPGEPRAAMASIEPPAQDRPGAASPSGHEDTSAEGEAEPAARRASRGWRLTPYLLAAVGVAGIGGFVLGTTWGRKDNAALRSCSPNCPQTSVDHVKRLYLAADVSLGIGAAALSSAALIWAISPSRADKEQESARRSAASHPPRSSTDLSLGDWESRPPKRDPDYDFGMYPTKGGAYAHFSGSF